jgi:hypothetical protein
MKLSCVQQPPLINLEKVLAMSHYICYVTSMARGESGRIVIEVEPEMKKRLYAALALSGSTLKDWFLKKATAYCHESVEPSLFENIESRPQEKNGFPVGSHKAGNGKK